MSEFKFASVPELVAEIAAGRMVILVDDEGRENEGDVVLAADMVTPEAINFMARFCRGLICLTLSPERCDALQLPPMVPRNGTKHGTAFTVSIEAAEGVDTGISAADRARTIQVAVDPASGPAALVQPGHVFPLRAATGGVLARAGHTEAGCDLTRMAGLQPASVICEIMKDDGTMARLPDLIEFAQTHGLKLGSIADLIQYRSEREKLVSLVGERPLHTEAGTFQLRTYSDDLGGVHLALSVGTWQDDDAVLVRVHEPVSVMDVLDVDASGHSWPLLAAMREIQAHGAGVLVLLNASEGGEQLLRAAQQGGAGHTPDGNTESAWRTFGIGSQILQELNVKHMRVLGNPRRFPSLGGFGLEAREFIPHKA